MSTATLTPADSASAIDQRRMFEAAFAEYYPRVRSALAARVRDWHIADELAQATFTRMWDQVAAGDVDLGDYDIRFGWLMGWARYTSLHHHATSSARVEHATGPDELPDTPDAMAADPADTVAGREYVTGLLAGIPAHIRRALVLHVLDDLPLEQVAAATSTSPTEAAALIEHGIARVRDLLGVTPDQIRARNQITAQHATRRELTAAARTPLDRPAQLRRALATAIADGTYPPGTVLPPARTLAGLHAPAATAHDRDHQIASRVLQTLRRKGILSGAPQAGYTVTDDAPRLAAAYTEPVPARTALARDLLAGIWGPGSQLPAPYSLARRWHCDSGNVNALLDSFVDAGALIRTPDGCYYTTPEPGTEFTPTGRTHRPGPRDPQAVLAAVIDQATTTGQLPTLKQIKATHRVGADTATRIRDAAAQQAGIVAPVDHAVVLAAVIEQATTTGRIPTLKQLQATHRVSHQVAARIRAQAAEATGLHVRTASDPHDRAAVLAAVLDQARATGTVPTQRQITNTHRISTRAANSVRAEVAEITGLHLRTRRTREAMAAIQAAVIDQARTTGRIPTLRQIRETHQVNPVQAVRLRREAVPYAAPQGHATPTRPARTSPAPAGSAAASAPGAGSDPHLAGDVPAVTGAGVEHALDQDVAEPGHELALEDALSL